YQASRELTVPSARPCFTIAKELLKSPLGTRVPWYFLTTSALLVPVPATIFFPLICFRLLILLSLGTIKAYRDLIYGVEKLYFFARSGVCVILFITTSYFPEPNPATKESHLLGTNFAFSPISLAT